MNPKETLIREFISICEWQFKKAMPQMLRTVWLHAFDDVHLDRLSRAMTQYLATSKWFPMPEDVREIALALPQSPDELAERAEKRRLHMEDLERRMEAARQEELPESVSSPRKDADTPLAGAAKVLAAQLGKNRPACTEAQRAEAEIQKAIVLCDDPVRRQTLLNERHISGKPPKWTLEEWQQRAVAHARHMEPDMTGGETESLVM